MITGRALDAEVAEKVMGLTVSADRQYAGIPNRRGGLAGMMPLIVKSYSTDIAAAWEVVEKLNKDGFYFDIDNQYQYHADGEWEACFAYLSDEGNFTARADTAPMAICLAALKALGAAKGGRE